MEKAKALLEQIVFALVSSPHEVSITASTDELGVLLSLQVAQADMGKIIGKEGSTAKAIRTVLRVVGMTEQARVNLKIVEPEGSRHYRREKSDADMLNA